MKRILFLILMAAGCSAEGVGTTDNTAAQRGPGVLAPDGETPDPQAAAPDAGGAWKDSLTVGAGYYCDGGPPPDYWCESDVLVNVGTSFSVFNTGSSLVFRVESVADIAGRSAVIYSGDLTALVPQIYGGAFGPASGHVVLGQFSPPTGTTLIRACLTTADRNKDGWSVGMVCDDVAMALITMAP